MVVTTALRNVKDTGHPLRVQVWALLSANVWQLAFGDLAMVASTWLAMAIQMLIRRSRGWLRWYNAGMVIQSVYQMAWLTLWIK
jgi:sterol O-acyltransferase